MGGRSGRSHHIPYFKSIALILEHETWTEDTLAWKHFKNTKLRNETTHVLLTLALLVENR